MFGYGRLAASEGIYYRVVCCWKGERGVAFHHVAIMYVTLSSFFCFLLLLVANACKVSLDMLALYIYNYMSAQPPWSLWLFGE